MIVPAGTTTATDADLTPNTHIGLAVLKACLAAGIQRCLLASSSAVYGPGKGLREDATLRPLNPYGAAKRDMEQKVADLVTPELNHCFLRIGNVAGADSLVLNAVGTTAEKPLTIDRFADGRGPVRSYIGPYHLAKVLLGLAAVTSPLPHVLNVGAQQPIDMIDLARAYMQRHINLRPAGPSAVQHVTLDCAKLAEFVPLPKNAADPAEMVRQCRNLRRH